MPATPNRITVDPQGMTVTVDILDQYATSITCYDSDGGASAHSLPLAISGLTDFYVTDKGQFTVSAKFAGVEICGDVVNVNGVPKLVKVNPAATPARIAALLADRADLAGTPVAFTQTYATAATTVPAATFVAVATDVATVVSPYGFTEPQANALVAGVNANAADILAVKKLVNALIDLCQAAGLAT